MTAVSPTYRDFAQRVLSTADIVEVVGQYVELKRAGSNLKGLCPFHQEKTPSFNVHPGKQIFKCFGCGKGGDVITFVREIERADFRQALEILARRYGLEMPRLQARGPDEETLRRHETMAQARELAAQHFQQRLAHHEHGAKARRYLAERGISPGDRLEIIGSEPYGGPVQVRIGDQVHSLGVELIAAMRVAVAVE